MFRRLEAPQSLRDSSLKEGASGKTGKCYGLPGNFAVMRESWQARQGLTERTSQLPGAHSKSFVLSPETVQFLIFPPLKVKNPAEKTLQMVQKPIWMCYTRC